jgi:membrane protease YdiL (CAAX protease family)
MDPVVTPNETTVGAPEPAWQKLAPTWHTALLIALLLATSISGAYSSHAAQKHGNLVVQYCVQIAWEWLIFGFVVWGVRRNGITVRNLIGGRWEHFEDFLLDVAIGIGGWITCYLAAAAVAVSTGILKHPDAIRKAKSAVEFLYPHTTLESIVAVCLAVTAGICEEMIFRGYLQRQFSAYAKNAWVGLVVGALLFGASHGYQTWWQMVLICVIGLVLGTMAHFRKSVRPGILTHSLIDSASLLLGRFVKLS